jgi:hypothetical protein
MLKDEEDVQEKNNSLPLHTTHRHSPSPQTRRDSNQKFRDFETSFDVSQVGLQYAHEL